MNLQEYELELDAYLMLLQVLEDSDDTCGCVCHRDPYNLECLKRCCGGS